MNINWKKIGKIGLAFAWTLMITALCIFGFLFNKMVKQGRKQYKETLVWRETCKPGDSVSIYTGRYGTSGVIDTIYNDTTIFIRIKIKKTELWQK